MDQTGDRTLLRDSILFTLISIGISQLALGDFFSCIPLLFLSQRIRKKQIAVIPFLVSLAVLLVITVLKSKELFVTGMYGRLFISVIYSISVTVGSVLWVFLRDRGNVVIRKIFICTIPAFIISVFFSLWLTLESNSAELDGIRQIFVAALPKQLSGVMDIHLLAQVCVSVLLTMSAPIGMVITSVPLLASDCTIHSGDSRWQEDFANMALPRVWVWPFMGLWILTLLGNMVFTYPPYLSVLLLNTTFAMTLHYMLSGVSVLFFKIRKKNPSVKAGTILMYLMLLSFMPGLNLAIMTGLCISGVLETWLDMRK